MKTTSCPACSGTVSTAAVACPHCGHPFAPPQKSVAKGVFWGLFGFFILLPIGIGIVVLLMGGTLVGAGKFFESKMQARKEKQEQEDASAMAVAQKEADERIAIRRQLEAEREAAERTPEALAARAARDASDAEAKNLADKEEQERRRKHDEEMTRPARERAAKLIAYQLAQASNGFPSFQIEMAKRYMRGDGVPLDNALARFWLEAACTNRESEATNLLKTLAK